MACREHKKIEKKFPPLIPRNDFFSEKKTNDTYTKQRGKERGVQKAPMTEEMIGRDV
jgi:hypothetical protein